MNHLEHQCAFALAVAGRLVDRLPCADLPPEKIALTPSAMVTIMIAIRYWTIEMIHRAGAHRAPRGSCTFPAPRMKRAVVESVDDMVAFDSNEVS